MSIQKKASVCMILALFWGVLSMVAAEFGGLWCVIIPVILVTIVESLFSSLWAHGTSKTVLWFGVMFHLAAAVFFFVLCSIGGHEMFQDFEYIIDYGHGNWEFVTDDAVLWWFLIASLAFRVVVIEPYLLIVHAVNKKKQSLSE